MGLKRLLLLVVLGVSASAVVPGAASAGGIRDWEPCPDSAGTLICPVGEVGVPYTVRFRAVEEPPCQPGEDFWYVKQDAPPPGLSLAPDGTMSGTPTQAGTYAFWVEMKLPDNDHCNGTADTTQERFEITIRQGLAKLTIGPESTPPGTTGTPYSLQLTATVADAKTWTINSGALPPGLVLNASTGLISGTPTAPGQYTFEVRAKMNADARADTKALGIVVRAPLAIAAAEPFSPTRRALGEVSAPFEATLTASGGSGTYTWSVSTGELPSGLLFANGVISGTPRVAGAYSFTVALTDTEGRVANYPVTIVVAEQLTVSTLLLRPGRVGKLYGAKVKTIGGVKPVSWRIARGPLPRGVRFNRLTGQLSGVPKRAGSFRVTFEASDELGVVATKTLRIVIAPAPKPKRSG